MEQPNMVIVGASKPVLNYVTACITNFNRGAEEICVRARGEAISNAVDVVLLLQSRFMSDVSIRDIQIDSEVVTAKDGRSLNLPVIEIFISKRRT